jgi:hypothetical protein
VENSPLGKTGQDLSLGGAVQVCLALFKSQDWKIRILGQSLLFLCFLASRHFTSYIRRNIQYIFSIYWILRMAEEGTPFEIYFSHCGEGNKFKLIAELVLKLRFF